MPEAGLDGCPQWSHLSSGHTGANRSVDFFRECFYSSLTLTELGSRMQTIVDACGCHASKQSDSRDRGLISSLPIPYCANSLLDVDFIHGLPRFGGYDSCLVVTCGLSRFTRVFPCNKKITGEQTVKMLVEQWFEPYGAPKQVHSDEDVRICSDTGWYKRVLNALNVEVTTGVPYTHTSNPLCERQNRVVEQNLRILMKQERTKDWVRLVPWAVLSMNSQRSSSTGFTPHELFHGGRPAWFFKAPFPEDFKSPVGDWLEHKQSLANQAGTNLRHRFFCSVGDWQRPPPPILRVPNTKKHFLASRKVIQTNFCSLSSPKSAIFCQKCAEICHFLARNRFFRPGGDFQDPPPLFQGCPMQQKRVTGAKECTWTSFGSLSPPKCHIFRQKSAKINFGMSLLHKIIGAFVTVNRADGTAYGDLPASRLVTSFWYTIHAYPPGHVTAYRTLTLDPIVSSG